MMDRLDSIAPILQYANHSNWSLPCEPNAIPALQNWLEQLSASIQTDDNIYPNILNSRPSVTEAILTPQDTLLSTEDYDLYPKLSDNHVWTSSDVSPHSKQSASESSFANTPPLYEQNYSSPASYDKNLKAQFWSPGYISTKTSYRNATPPPLPPRPLQQPDLDYYTPSDAIDFNQSVKFEQQSVEPNVVFEISKMDVESDTVEPILSNYTSTFNDKKELVHMINVFSSSNSLKYTKKLDLETVESTVTEQREEDIKGKVRNDESRDNDSRDDDDASEDNNSDEDEDEDDEYDSFEEEDVKCPYADLVGLVQNMKVEDKESIRKRHALLVETLWKRIAVHN